MTTPTERLHVTVDGIEYRTSPAHTGVWVYERGLGWIAGPGEWRQVEGISRSFRDVAALRRYVRRNFAREF